MDRATLKPFGRGRTCCKTKACKRFFPIASVWTGACAWSIRGKSARVGLYQCSDDAFELRTNQLAAAPDCQQNTSKLMQGRSCLKVTAEVASSFGHELPWLDSKLAVLSLAVAFAEGCAWSWARCSWSNVACSGLRHITAEVHVT